MRLALSAPLVAVRVNVDTPIGKKVHEVSPVHIEGDYIKSLLLKHSIS